MEIHTTARRVKVTAAVQRHLDERISKLTRYVPELAEAHVKLTAEKYRHRAEILIHVRHRELVAKEESNDLLAAIDAAADRLENQLRRLKDKKSRKVASRRVAPQEPRRSAARAALGLVSPASKIPAPRASARPSGNGSRSRVVRDRRPQGKPLSVEEAADRLEESGDSFVVFVDSASDLLCVLYRRKDGQLGLVESRG
jgi:putative sigma-54 modulation protein